MKNRSTLLKVSSGQEMKKNTVIQTPKVQIPLHPRRGKAFLSKTEHNILKYNLFKN